MQKVFSFRKLEWLTVLRRVLLMCLADLKQNHTQLPFLHEIHLYTVKPEGGG